MIRKVGRCCRKCYIHRVKSLVGEKGVIIIFGEGFFLHQITILPYRQQETGDVKNVIGGQNMLSSFCLHCL